jgi:hypothetical protein
MYLVVLRDMSRSDVLKCRCEKWKLKATHRINLSPNVIVGIALVGRQAKVVVPALMLSEHDPFAGKRPGSRKTSKVAADQVVD